MGNVKYLDKKMVGEFLEKIPTLKLRKITHNQVRLMFEALLYGGMRISEVLQITPSSLIGGGKVKLMITKGGVERCKCSVWEFRPTTLISSDKDCPKCQGKGKYRIAAFAWIDNPEVYEELQELAKGKKPEERLFPIHRSWAWHY